MHRQVKVPFADSKRSDTRAFARDVLELRSSMTLSDVARHLGVSWWLVKDIETRHLETHFARPKLRHVTRIAIDESPSTKSRSATDTMQKKVLKGTRRLLLKNPGPLARISHQLVGCMKQVEG